MSCAAILRQSGGSIILSIPKAIAQTLAVEAGSVVELAVEGRTLSVTPARQPGGSSGRESQVAGSLAAG